MNEVTHTNVNAPIITAILVDNDELVRRTWNLAARIHCRPILTCSTADELRGQMQRLPVSTPIYIDLELGQGTNGLQVAKELYEAGFTQLYISTGHNPRSVAKPTWVRAIVGKNPPWTEKPLL